MSKQIPIPQNVENGGGIFQGRFKLRNGIEAGVLFFLSFTIIFKVIGPFISMNAQFILFLIVGGGLSVLGLVGIEGKSLSEAVIIMLNYKRRARSVTLKMPRREKDEIRDGKDSIFKKLTTKRGGESSDE